MSAYIQFTGPIYIGSVLNWFLFGSFIVQLCKYTHLRHVPNACLADISEIDDYYILYQQNDQRFIKTIVFFVFAAEITQLIFMNHTVWHILVAGYGDPTHIFATPWSSASAPVLNGIISAAVQMRIWILGKHRVAQGLSVFIALVSSMQCVASLVTTIQFSLLGREPERLGAINSTVIVWLSGSFLCDVLIAATMVTILARSRSNASFRNTERIINVLIVNTIETGAVTAVVALLQLVFFLTHTDNFIHVCMEYVLGRIFSNVLMATLNGRHRLRTKNDEYSASLSRIAVDQFRLKDMSVCNPTKSSPEGVHISTELEVHTDASSVGRKGFPL
ncbi:hypothetical protein Hypma_012674 [Hypsizygus marmoreus]|uniref:DUF6534 domain-containing protein n=1 Tax=Hypsizygus marmoreus TaxID=39966 RepID=A0A369JEH7_HYPMA|nr:hypothetical protein Hypma_012674 [Hypsizygus marmoreus]